MLPTGFDGWIKTLAGPYLSAVPAERRGPILDDACRRLHLLTRPDGTAVADYVRLRFVAMKPA